MNALATAHTEPQVSPVFCDRVTKCFPKTRPPINCNLCFAKAAHTKSCLRYLASTKCMLSRERVLREFEGSQNTENDFDQDLIGWYRAHCGVSWKIKTSLERALVDLELSIDGRAIPFFRLLIRDL